MGRRLNFGRYFVGFVHSPIGPSDYPLKDQAENLKAKFRVKIQKEYQWNGVRE